MSDAPPEPGDCEQKDKRMGLCDGVVELYPYLDAVGIPVPDVKPKWLCRRHLALQDGAEPF